MANIEGISLPGSKGEVKAGPFTGLTESMDETTGEVTKTFHMAGGSMKIVQPPLYPGYPAPDPYVVIHNKDKEEREVINKLDIQTNGASKCDPASY